MFSQAPERLSKRPRWFVVSTRRFVPITRSYEPRASGKWPIRALCTTDKELIYSADADSLNLIVSREERELITFYWVRWGWGRVRL